MFNIWSFIFILLQICICSGFTVTIADTTDTLFISTEDECKPSPGSPVEYSCSGLLNSESLVRLVPPETVQLTIHSSNLTALHASHIQHLTQLATLTLVTSRVVFLSSPWPPSVPLQQITIHQCWSQLPSHAGQEALGATGVKPHLSLDPQIWSRLSTLTNLTVIDCNVIVADLGLQGALVGFDLLPPGCFLTLRNGEYECQGEHVYLLQMVADGRAAVHNTTCFILDDISMFNSLLTFNDMPLISVLKHRKKSMEACPQQCQCELLGFRSIDRPLLAVNCSSAGFTALPAVIPPYASTLILSNNKLRNVDSAFTNPHYSRLSTMDFTNNSISSVNGSALVQYIASRNHDVKFDLRHNKLKTFPVWEVAMFYSTLQRSGKKHLPLFYLSGNPWDCSNCSFGPYFKSFVYDNMFHVRDHVDVRCGESLDLILHMDFNALCNPPSSPILPIDVLNVFMAIILTILLADFAYNYYQYRRHGKLPWIVRNCKIC